jgi:hypothetical protein
MLPKDFFTPCSPYCPDPMEGSFPSQEKDLCSFDCGMTPVVDEAEPMPFDPSILRYEHPVSRDILVK